MHIILTLCGVPCNWRHYNYL